MASAGVTRAVLIPSQAEDSLTYALEALGGFPYQFAVLDLVDPRRQRTPQRLKELATQRKLAGVQLRPGLEPRQTWLNSPQTLPLWEALCELDLPVSLLMRSHQYNQLSDIVTGFPRVRIILDHLGQGPETRRVVPQYLPVLLEYSRYPQVYVKISKLFQLSRHDHPHQDLWPVLENIYDRFGPERMIWGSDYPSVLRYCGYQNEAQLIDVLPFLSSGERSWIQYKTAERLWFQSNLFDANSDVEGVLPK